MRVLVDLGSSSVKVYYLVGRSLDLVEVKTILFKDGYSDVFGIKSEKIEEVIKIINRIRLAVEPEEIDVYATAIFRKLNSGQTKEIESELDKLGAKLHILSHEQENDYLHRACVGSYKGKLPILLVNIGGGSVELVVMQEGKVVEKQNLDLGVMSVLQEFPSINENLTPDLALEVKDKVKKDIEKFKTSLEWSIYTGGELTYMKLAKYKLITNRLFKNANHPLMISMKNFSKRNLGIYFNSTLSDLKKLMKDNPEWMKGAKTCCLMAEAIFEKLEIKYIIPTDVNLIHGVVYTD